MNKTEACGYILTPMIKSIVEEYGLPFHDKDITDLYIASTNEYIWPYSKDINILFQTKKTTRK